MPSRNVDDTPAMRQYHRFKEQHPDCVLFFRLGDFYEMFHDDAKLAHRVLGVTLTQRTEGIPMAGVPYHAVESYLRRMIQAGYRVAVCDQMEDPALARASGAGIVKRDVTRVITPGTLIDEHLLEDGRANPLLAVMFRDDQHAGAAWAELSTGSFWIADFTAAELAEEAARVGPCEILYVETANHEPPPRVQALVEGRRCALTGRPAWQFRQNEAVECLCRQFQVATLAGFGLSDDDLALGPASAIVHYLLETQCAAEGGAPRSHEEAEAQRHEGLAHDQKPEIRNRRSLPHLQPPRRFSRADHLIIDPVSLRSLEVETTIRSGDSAGALLGVLLSGGECRTAMGKRLLRQWLCYPLGRREPIEKRQRVVGALVEDHRFLEQLRGVLSQVQDVPRMVGRVSVGRATPRDLVAVGRSAGQVAALTDLVAQRPAVAEQHQRLAAVGPGLTALAQDLARACVDNPPGHLRDGGLFRDGCDAQLDEYRGLQRDSNTWLAAYQKQLIDQTGIVSLKVGFNKVFGFYIELTATHKDKAPAGWSRKQTLKNAERFITQELKEYETKVLSAEQKAIARELELFARLGTRVQGEMAGLQALAETAAELDVLACFARRAVKRRYVKPALVDEPVLHIVAGRHPVLDEVLGDRFVPNDVELGLGFRGQGSGIGQAGPESLPGAKVRVKGSGVRDQESGQATSDQRPGTSGDATADQQSQIRNQKSLALITGPNMAGKSTYIRQAALIALLAHTGSFVPAEEATIGLCDRIFTRVGASDELHAGRSTFMVEMTEAANICHHASPASLVILDEIGRGTSTLDGLALAWAITEHLAARGCRTLFATHYHELTALAEQLPQVANLHVTVREWADQIVFLHRIAPGSTDRSYGVHVAKIAGLPAPVVNRAHEVLAQLELSHHAPVPGSAPGSAPEARAAGAKPQAARDRDGQLSLFTEYLNHPVVDDLRQLDMTGLSPLQAFDLLRKLKDKAQGKADASEHT